MDSCQPQSVIHHNGHRAVPSEKQRVPYWTKDLARRDLSSVPLSARFSSFTSSLISFRSASVPLSNDLSQADADAKAVIQATKMRDTLLAATEALETLRITTSLQASTLSVHIGASRLHREFISIPDEVLSVVLEYAALQRDPDDKSRSIVKSVKAAAKLSHVCKRFRKLIVHQPYFWNRWTNAMENSEMLSTCLSRCRNPSAKLLVKVLLYTLSFRTPHWQPIDMFLRIVCQKRETWRQFVLDGSGSANDSIDQFTDVALRDLAKTTSNIVLPLLTHLDIGYHAIVMRPEVRARDDVLDMMHFYSTWSAPRLQSMVTKNFIPIPFSGSPCLSSLSIHIGHTHWSRGFVLDFSAISSLLSACPVLEDFTLWIGGADNAGPPTLQGRRVEMTFVDKLNFRFELCNSTTLRILFENTYFPNASTLELRIGIPQPGMCDGVDHKARNIIHTMFPDAEAFPSLTSLTFNVYYVVEGVPRPLFDLLSIPLSHMPKLEYLNISSSFLDYMPYWPGLPAIRSLVLRDSYRLAKPRLVNLLQRLEAQGVLGSLRHVLLTDGFHEEKGGKGREPLTLSNEELRKLIK